MSSPNSPDLDPELAASLLESLTSWDPRASVPLALAYMRCGDEAALEGFDALALGSPVAREMLEDRYLSPLPDRKHLASLPQGSLGREYERYLADNDLDPNLLRESAFIEAHAARGDDVGYLAERGFQLHDLFHVLTGFDTTPLGEVRVVSFSVAQVPAPYPAMIERAGWEMTAHEDQTAAYFATFRKMYELEKANEDELIRLRGADDAAELLARRARTLDAIERDLLRREIFTVVVQ